MNIYSKNKIISLSFRDYMQEMLLKKTRSRIDKWNRKDIVLVGFDMADITVQIIQNPDYFAGILMQRQDQMGYLGLTALYDFVSGSRYEQKYFDTGVVLIDADYLSGRE